MPDRILLASRSPRRRELIALLGVPVELCDPPEVDEEGFAAAFAGKPEDIPAALAELKIKLVMPSIDEGARPSRSHEFIVCADTDVIHKGQALGKPLDDDDAARMLRLLSGDWHVVVTGVSVANAEDRRIITRAEKTRVKFAELTSSEIERYIATGEPHDKAGAYGIQGFAAPLVERIEGCYHNVVGLPLNLLYRLLKESGFHFD